MTTDNETTNQEVTSDSTGRLDALVSGIDEIIADMKEQIEYSRKHGDNWEADFLEGFSDHLAELLDKYR